MAACGLLVSDLCLGTMIFGEEGELVLLNQASALPELYPYRMIEVYGQRLPNS